MNLIVFNYRGYGRSDMNSSSKFLQRKLGVMNPDDVMQDAEVVLEYAKEKFIQLPETVDGSNESRVAVKVLVHGESLGGMAASYVAMKGRRTSVDFAFIDRSFASLDSVAFWGAGASLMRSTI